MSSKYLRDLDRIWKREREQKIDDPTTEVMLAFLRDHAGEAVRFLSDGHAGVLHAKLIDHDGPWKDRIGFCGVEPGDDYPTVMLEDMSYWGLCIHCSPYVEKVDRKWHLRRHPKLLADKIVELGSQNFSRFSDTFDYVHSLTERECDRLSITDGANIDDNFMIGRYAGDGCYVLIGRDEEDEDWIRMEQEEPIAQSEHLIDMIVVAMQRSGSKPTAREMKNIALRKLADKDPKR